MRISVSCLSQNGFGNQASVLMLFPVCCFWDITCSFSVLQTSKDSKLLWERKEKLWCKGQLHTPDLSWRFQAEGPTASVFRASLVLITAAKSNLNIWIISDGGHILALSCHVPHSLTWSHQVIGEWLIWVGFRPLARAAGVQVGELEDLCPFSPCLWRRPLEATETSVRDPNIHPP